MDASLLQHVLMDRTHFCKSVSGIQFNVHLGYETLCFTMYLLTCPGSVNAGSSAKTTYLADVFNICKMVLPSDTLFGCQASFSSCPVGASMSPDQKKKIIYRMLETRPPKPSLSRAQHFQPPRIPLKFKQGFVSEQKQMTSPHQSYSHSRCA